MPRKRRSPEEAKKEILTAAKELLLEEGPDALKISKIAKKAGTSHPLVLHHFGSAELLLVALQEKVARDIRDTLLDKFKENTVHFGVLSVFNDLSSPHQAKLMAWLIARGYSPFPPAKEKGLQIVLEALQDQTNLEKEELRNVILLILFISYGEGMFGAELRERLGMEHSETQKIGFLQWVLSLLD